MILYLKKHRLNIIGLAIATLFSMSVPTATSQIGIKPNYKDSFRLAKKDIAFSSVDNRWILTGQLVAKRSFSERSKVLTPTGNPVHDMQKLSEEIPVAGAAIRVYVFVPGETIESMTDYTENGHPVQSLTDTNGKFFVALQASENGPVNMSEVNVFLGFSFIENSPTTFQFKEKRSKQTKAYYPPVESKSDEQLLKEMTSVKENAFFIGPEGDHHNFAALLVNGLGNYAEDFDFDDNPFAMISRKVPEVNGDQERSELYLIKCSTADYKPTVMVRRYISKENQFFNKSSILKNFNKIVEPKKLTPDPLRWDTHINRYYPDSNSCSTEVLPSRYIKNEFMGEYYIEDGDNVRTGSAASCEDGGQVTSYRLPSLCEADYYPSSFEENRKQQKIDTCKSILLLAKKICQRV